MRTLAGWKDHIEAVRRKCYVVLAKISRLRESLPAVKIYDALVLPHLDCCYRVWQECWKALQQKVERIQNYAMRLICSKPPRTSSQDLRKGMNWTPLMDWNIERFSDWFIYIDASTIRYQDIYLIPS